MCRKCAGNMNKHHKSGAISFHQRNVHYTRRMNIYKKLILSLVGLTSIILIATLLLARWSFEQGFNNFLQSQEMARLSRISDDIIQVAPSATSLIDIEKRSLIGILERHSVIKNGPRGPRPQDSRQGGRPIPPHLRDQVSDRPPNRAGGRPPIDKASFQFTAIYDSSGNYLAGNILDEKRLETFITFDYTLMNNNEVIGSIKSWKREKFESPIATEFSKQQISTSVFIGFFSLGLALVLSYFGAKTLLAPIKLIIGGVEDLSNGNYTKALANNRVDEFGELINNVNRLGSVLEQTRTAKNRWFADISHELRTPLTVLMGELEALKMGIRPLSMEQIDSLTQEALLLKRLIDDLYQLSISDIGALRYEFSDVDVSALMSKVVEQANNLAKVHSISIEQLIEAGAVVSCDKNRITQLLTNLLNNSIAYTNSNGIITASLLVKKEYICISVEDSAPTLSTEECAQIFEPLYRQNKARTRNAAGAGLGLAICKNIVEAHGGEIIAKPSTLGGVEINVTLPFHKKRE